MTDTEIEQLLDEVATTRRGARAAVARLVAAGHHPEAAEEMVFTALGGSDLVETGADGRERFFGSGRLVREVLAEMEQ
jgi:hypothetical protein